LGNIAVREHRWGENLRKKARFETVNSMDRRIYTI
jgi:hypothetical protein